MPLQYAIPRCAQMHECSPILGDYFPSHVPTSLSESSVPLLKRSKVFIWLFSDAFIIERLATGWTTEKSGFESR
jgi:hypothetical protein